jgi:hypothetical protein
VLALACGKIENAKYHEISKIKKMSREEAEADLEMLGLLLIRNEVGRREEGWKAKERWRMRKRVVEIRGRREKGGGAKRRRGTSSFFYAMFLFLNRSGLERASREEGGRREEGRREVGKTEE